MKDSAQSHSTKESLLDFKIPGVGESFFSKIGSFLNSNKNKFYSEIQSRYKRQFLNIFPDIDANHFKDIKIDFSDSVGKSLGETDPVSRRITFPEVTRNHPLFPIIHAHELQHYYDLKTQKIKPFENVDELSEQAYNILKSEIRAHLRHLRASKILFTNKELQDILLAEKNSLIKDFLQELIDYGDNETNYVAMALKRVGYSFILSQAQRNLGVRDPYLFLLTEIEAEITRLPVAGE